MPATFDRVADRPGDRRRVVATAGGRPEPDPEQPAGRGDPPSVRVGQVATVVGDAAEPRVRGDDRPGGHRQDVVDRRRRGMGDVDQHPARLHPADHLAPGGGQAALVDAVRRPAERVVEEVARRHHPEARVGDDLDVRRVAIERMGALDRQEAGGEARIEAARRLVVGQVAARPDDPERAIGAGRQVVGPGSQVERPRQQPPPRRGRPAEREGQEHDVVAAVVVALDVEVPRRFRGGGEDLQGDIALAQARDVDLAARRALEQVPAPQQRIGMEVRDPQRLVEGPRPVRGAVRRRARPSRTAAPRSARRGRARPRASRPPSAAPAAPTARASPRRRLILGPISAASGPRRGRPASARRVRARSARTRAGRPRSRARCRAPGGARRSPRCRAAGRPSAA